MAIWARCSSSKTLVEAAAAKGPDIPDKFNNVAIVKFVASTWVDYLEMAKFNGEWKIINVLWELKPKSVDAPAATTRQKP